MGGMTEGKCRSNINSNSSSDSSGSIIKQQQHTQQQQHQQQQQHTFFSTSQIDSTYLSTPATN